MSFPFGSTPKTASGFTLPATTAATTSAPAGGGFAFNLGQSAGSGDNKQASAGLFATPINPAATAVPTGLAFNLGQPAKTTATGLSFATPTIQSSTATGGLTFGLGAPGAATSAAPTTSANTLQFSFNTPASSAAATTSATSFTPILGATTTASSAAAKGITFGAQPSPAPGPKLGLTTTTTASATTTASTGFALATTTIASVAPTQTTTTTSSIPATGSLTFAQLEDSINKWTIDLEEQGKFFVNQAKQLNAWDTLLISNGEKILNLNSSIERVKQQQSQLDQELDFILAQQKELEELIVPLEKELVDIPVTDIDRNQMYQFAEIIDSQLKQISDDLKEIIENINESNKDEEISNPINQISKILNAHMNSLTWIDRNTAQISRQLEEISKIEDANRRNLSLNNSITMFQ